MSNELKRPIVEEDEHQSSSKRFKGSSGCKTAGAEDKRKWQFLPKKVMTALLFAYNGQKYSSVERKSNTSTAEEEILHALLCAKVINADMYAVPEKGRFQMARKVDAGASAALQIVSSQLIMVDNLIDEVNSHLSSDVRLFGYKTVTKKFIPSKACELEVFNYLLPTFSFASPNEQEELFPNYRLSDSRLTEVNRILAMYEGTHSFQSFLVQSCTNASSLPATTVTECQASQPFLVNNIEYIKVSVKGDNFSLGQICKMIGLAIAVVRNLIDENAIAKALETQQINVPSSPSVGLVLEELQCTRYNVFVKRNQIYEELVWDDLEEKLKKFKEEYIYCNIFEKEKTENSMLNWLHMLNGHSFDMQQPPENVEVQKVIIDKENSTNNTEVQETSSLPKKKMVVIMMAFSGQGYTGMQRNPGIKTIEEDFLQALLQGGFITKDEYDTPQIVGFQRSCRTDKGVSAAMQIVSMKLRLKDDVIGIVNSYLPPQIKVFGYKNVTKKFNSKTSCDARTYSYMLPTVAFSPDEELENVENFRISEAVLNHINEVLGKFEGTHRFHNFTAGRAANDASCQRYIISFRAGQPFVRENIEFLIITVKGQSFMLHQIRKMIGLSIAIVRGLTTVETIDKAWAPERIDIPIAPSLGLVLEEVHYDRYNQRYGTDGFHQPIVWDEHKDELQEFKEEFIYPTIISGEKNESRMQRWLDTLKCHSYDVRIASDPSSLPPNKQVNESIKKENEQTDAENAETENAKMEQSDNAD